MVNKFQMNQNARLLRKRFRLSCEDPIDIFSIVSFIDNLTITFFPMSTRLSGLCIKIEHSNIVGINSTMTYGRQRFTMAHELCHLYYHHQLKNSVCVSQFDGNCSRERYEQEADIFASYFLAPYEALHHYIDWNLAKKKGNLELEDVVRIEQYFGLSRAAILNRLLDEHYISERMAEAMKTCIISSAQQLGFDATLYRPSKENKRYNTIGQYIQLAKDIEENPLITKGKYEELLFDAFRADLVYGIKEDEEEIYD